MIIAGAGGAAHLPGMVAALTPLPVIGVPVVPANAHLGGLDALASIVQMPRGVPVATVAIGNATNAGLLAVRILAATRPALLRSMVNFANIQARASLPLVDSTVLHPFLLLVCTERAHVCPASWRCIPSGQRGCSMALLCRRRQ